MSKILSSKQTTLLNSQGQAFGEYILMILVALSLVVVMASGFRKTLVGIWGFYIKQISAACPGCPVNPNYRFR